MNDKGFTLVELVVMIAVLAMISIISFVSINGITSDSKIDNCNSLVHNIKNAAREYVSDNRYKSTFDSDNNKIETIGVDLLISGNYLKANDPDNKIINPFKTDEKIEPSTITVKITLNNDYTAKEITIQAPAFLNNCENGI